MDGDRRPLVLLLGADRYVVQACQRHDVDAVVALGSSGFDYGLAQVPEGLTVLRVDDQASPEAVLLGLHRAGLGDRAFDAIQTTDEWALVTAGVLAAHLGCRAIDPVTAVHFRDKSLQKRRVADAGVATARVTVIEDIYDVSAHQALAYDRAVLKPIAGAATARTTVIDGIAELHRLSRRYRDERVPQRSFALEEYVAGDEWTADGIVFDGDLLFYALGSYGEPCVTAVYHGQPLRLRRFDPKTEAWAYERGEPVVRRALEALGLRDGVFHMELFHDPATGRLAFSECAARRGGALVHEELQAKFNVNLGESALLCALGRRPDLQVEYRPETIGGTYLLGRPGTLVGCPAPAELLALPGVEFARVEAPFGAQFSADVGSTNQRVAQVLVAAGSEAQLVRRFAEIREWFDERLVVVPHGATPRELRAWQRDTWPDADYGDTLWS